MPPGIACFNACCKNTDIALTPYDIVRLKRRFKLDSKEFVAEYTVPFETEFHGVPASAVSTSTRQSGRYAATMRWRSTGRTSKPGGTAKERWTVDRAPAGDRTSRRQEEDL